MSEHTAPVYEPDWEEIPPPDTVYGRIGHALRKINEIDGVATHAEADVEWDCSDETEATITIVASDAVIPEG